MRPEILAKLRTHQREPAPQLLQILQSGGVAFDLSDTGTGKTFVAAAIAAELKIPTLAIVPKIAETSWHDAAAHFDDKLSVVGWELLRTGATPFGRWENGPPPPKSERMFFKCPNCQMKLDPAKIIPCSAHWAGLHCFEVKTTPHKYGKFIFHPAIRLIIFDEIHRASGDSLNADMVIAAKRSGAKVLGLTATLAHSPLHLRATGYLAGLHQLGNFDYWAGKQGCRRVPMRGYQWLAPKDKQVEIMRGIGAQIIPSKGIRLTRDQIPDFPGRNIQAELFDLPAEDTAELNELYDVLSTPLADLEARASADVDPELGLTKRLRARQRIELLKVGVAEELGRDYLEKDFSVVWFVNYRQTIDELLRRFPGAGVIDGTITGKPRERVVAAFQSNSNRRLIVNNLAGSVALSLQDLQGDSPRVGLVFPADSPVIMEQLFGRLARSGGKSDALYRVIFASKSVEVPMRRSLELQYNNLDALKNNRKDACNPFVVE